MNIAAINMSVQVFLLYDDLHSLRYMSRSSTAESHYGSVFSFFVYYCHAAWGYTEVFTKVVIIYHICVYIYIYIHTHIYIYIIREFTPYSLCTYIHSSHTKLHPHQQCKMVPHTHPQSLSFDMVYFLDESHFEWRKMEYQCHFYLHFLYSYECWIFLHVLIGHV
jgi:hypothetical protein